INPQGKTFVHVDEKAFPTPPLFLNDIVVDPENTIKEQQILYVSDSGDLKGNGGAIYRISTDSKTKKIAATTVIEPKRDPRLKVPNGLVMDGRSFLLMVDSGSGELLRIRISD